MGRAFHSHVVSVDRGSNGIGLTTGARYRQVGSQGGTFFRAAGDALRAPFALGDPNRMAELCAAAGIKGARVAMQPGRGRFPSIRTMVEVDVRDWLRIVGITLDEDLIETVLRESESALWPFVSDEGNGVGFDSPAVLATATR